MPRDPATHVGVVVKISGVEIPCDPSVPGILSGLKVTWGRDDRVAEASASTCDFQVVDATGVGQYTSLVVYGATVEVLAEAPDGTRSRMFYGAISDLSLTHEDGPDAILSVTVIDPSPNLSTVSVGDTPWPAQSVDARRDAIVAALPADTVDLPAPNLSSTYDPGRLAPMDVDNRTAADLIQEFLRGIGIVAYPVTVAGAALKPGYHYAKPSTWYDGMGVIDMRTNRRVPVGPIRSGPPDTTPRDITTVVLDACDIDLDGTTFNANPAGISQPVRVTYGPSDEQLVYMSTTKGDRTLEVTSWVDVQSTGAPDSGARQVAINWAAQMSGWAYDFAAPWGVEAVRLDPDTVTGMDDFDQAMMVLLDETERIHQPVMLQNLPTWTPWRAADEPHAHQANVTGLLLGGTYTYDEGRWMLELQVAVVRALQSELAPLPVVVVHPGDVVPYDHDTNTVDFQPEPATMWPVGATATFTDGKYGWDGTAWVAGGTDAILVMPGSVHDDLAHDDARVQAQPSTSWPPGQYATFSDGTYRWDGEAWGPMVMVSPGETVSVNHADPSVAPDPDTAWAADDYATFTDGTYRWDGEAWTFYVVPIVVHPGDVVDVAHDAPGVTPEPATPWANGESATFTDGEYAWTGSAWTPPVWWVVDRVNLVYNPSFETGTDGWGSAPSVTTIARDTAWSAEGGASLKVMPTPGSTSIDTFALVEASVRASLEPGKTYTATATVHVDVPLVGDLRDNSLRIRVYGVGGTVWSDQAPNEPGDYVLSVTFTVPADGAVSAIRLYNGSGAVDGVDNAIWWDLVTIVEGTEPAQFDGDTPDTNTERYDWTGTPHASTSTLSVPGAEPIVVRPGDVVDVAHDAEGVTPEPATAWPDDDYVIFTDGAWRWDGEAWVVVWTVVATNLASNPHTASADGWAFNTGFGGQADVTTETASDTPDGRPGYRRATIVTPDTGGYSGHSFSEPEVGGAGEVLTFSVYVRASVALTFTLNASTRAGSSSADTGASPATDAPAGQWVRLSATVTTTKAYDALRVVLNENVAGPAAGTTVDATQVLLERHDALRDYFDGDTPDTDTERHDWLGTPGASRSTLSSQRTEPSYTPGSNLT